MDLKVKSYINTPPIYPYLNSVKNHFPLKISLRAEDPAFLEKSSFPFSVIIDSDPLARLLEARFVTDAGSELKKGFLLVQKDQYSFTGDELWPINNRDVDDYWQKTFAFYAAEKENPSLILLADQMDNERNLRPFQSLFFCKRKQVFFPPPCPQCGLPLEQCYDDDLLTRAGLLPYSTSLKRYLCCPSCSPKGRADFYVPELGSSDPSALKDRWVLIQEWSLFPNNKTQAVDFPCGECSDYPDCFGPKRQAPWRIVPFSFYPFYMFIFEAMSLNALDFLSLLSGAPWAEVEAHLASKQEAGRVRCLQALNPRGPGTAPSLYPPQDERYFGEVLFLKLSFLGELIQTFFLQGAGQKHPDLRLAMEKIWVKLGEQNGSLPLFWNFRVKVIEASLIPPQPGFFLKPPASDAPFFLGLVWFYAFLVNSKQDIARVYSSLKKGIDLFPQERKDSFEQFLAESFRSTFHPLNIFWNPEGKTASPDWIPLWEKSLRLGLSLFKASLSNDPQWSKEGFVHQLEALREEVRSNLLRGKLAEVSPAPAGEDEKLQEILGKILAKWRGRMEPEKEEVMETVILSPERVPRETIPRPPLKDQKEIFPETIITTRQKEVEAAVPETVILTRQEAAAAKVSGRGIFPPPETAQDVVPETVILHRSGAVKEETRPSPRVQPQEPQLGKPGSMAKEIKAPLVPKSEEPPVEDDFLGETVILPPGKGREKAKKDR